MKALLILIENFYPAYKGGGPIQSVTNLILAFGNEYNVYVITRAFDMQSKEILPGIKANSWNTICLPQGEKDVTVWYGEKSKPGYKTFKKLLNEVSPDIVYLNGIFSFNLFLLPLIAVRNSAPKPKVIICPRGMLQKGALADKTFKKKMYLKLLGFTGLLDQAVWHATNQEEKEDILKYFAVNKGVHIAMNIPKRPVEKVTCIEKNPGQLHLIYLSLITEKKNLLLLLELIKATENISLDIYGPVKDTDYWNQCQVLINQLPHKIKYHGDIMPLQVQDIFSQYHASILLTSGENFGHALYESLSVGRPLITSFFTPWNNLEEQKAGWNLDISDSAGCAARLDAIKTLDQSEFSKFCEGAYSMATDYFRRSNNLDNYKKLFSTTV